MRCIYCGTEPNNSTVDKNLKVCCCYMLHKCNGIYHQFYKQSYQEQVEDNLKRDCLKIITEGKR